MCDLIALRAVGATGIIVVGWLSSDHPPCRLIDRRTNPPAVAADRSTAVVAVVALMMLLILNYDKFFNTADDQFALAIRISSPHWSIALRQSGLSVSLVLFCWSVHCCCCCFAASAISFHCCCCCRCCCCYRFGIRNMKIMTNRLIGSPPSVDPRQSVSSLLVVSVPATWKE